MVESFFRKKELMLLLCLLLFWSCSPKSTDSDISKASKGTNLTCSQELATSVEAASDFALSPTNATTEDLKGVGASLAVSSFGDTGFGLTNSDSSDLNYEMITYAIEVGEYEEFYRVRLCDSNKQCQCYDSSCNGNYDTCTRYSSCSVADLSVDGSNQIWIKTSDTINTVSPMGLKDEISMKVKYCGTNYYQNNDYPGSGTGSFAEEVCGDSLASENTIYINEALSVSSRSDTELQKVDALASLMREKEEECSLLVDQFHEKAANFWYANKGVCEPSVEGQLPVEQGACVSLESLVGGIDEYKPLFCDQEAFYDLAVLISSGFASDEEASDESGASFGLVGTEKKRFFSLVDAEEAEALNCETLEGFEQFDEEESNPSVDAFEDFFSDFSGFSDPYELPSDDVISSDGVFDSSVDTATSDPTTEASTTTAYGNETVENPPLFDATLEYDPTEDPNLADGPMTQEELSALFVVTAGLFGIAALGTAVSMIKQFRPKDSLSKAEFQKLVAGNFDDLGKDADPKLKAFMNVVGNKAFKSYLKGEKVGKRYNLKPEGKSGFQSIKRAGLMGERLELKGSFSTDDLLKPKLVEVDGKFYAGIDMNSDVAKALGIADQLVEKLGYEVDGDGNYRKPGEIKASDLVDLGGGNRTLGSADFEKMRADLKANVGNKGMINVDFKAKTKGNGGMGFKRVAGLAAAGAALGGLIFAASAGAFDTKSSDSSDDDDGFGLSSATPIQDFLDQHFGDFFVNQVIPITSKAFCYGKNIDELTQDASIGYYSNMEYTNCVRDEVKGRGRYLVELFPGF